MQTGYHGRVSGVTYVEDFGARAHKDVVDTTKDAGSKLGSEGILSGLKHSSQHSPRAPGAGESRKEPTQTLYSIFVAGVPSSFWAVLATLILFSP